MFVFDLDSLSEIIWTKKSNSKGDSYSILTPKSKCYTQ